VGIGHPKGHRFKRPVMPRAMTRGRTVSVSPRSHAGPGSHMMPGVQKEAAEKIDAGLWAALAGWGGGGTTVRDAERRRLARRIEAG